MIDDQKPVDCADVECQIGDYGGVIDVTECRYVELNRLRLTAGNARRLAASLLKAASQLERVSS